MFRNRSVNVHQFAMVPGPDIPRSSFNIQTAHKTTLDAGYLVPIYVDEVLPGDTFKLKMTAFGRLATPLFPIMDNMYLDSFFFFVPNRLVWSNWVKFMGEQENPGDSTSYLIPQVLSPGYEPNTLGDYFGLPSFERVSPDPESPGSISHSVLPFRAYNLIWNEWFRDENLQDSVPKNMGDGPDDAADYTLLRRGKRHDYFTSALPWPQKGPSVALPLGTTAPVVSSGDPFQMRGATGGMTEIGTGGVIGNSLAIRSATTGNQPMNWGAAGALTTGLYADLSEATAATINQLRQSFQIQKLLERDARGGTRYTEIVRAHFGVISPDARLQRPEYLGGGSTPVNVNPIAQTSATDAGTPLGQLAAMGTVLAKEHGFTQSFTEHGYVIGLVSVRADLTYQEGIRKMWSRSTRYDFYFPAFAMLGEQAVLNKELVAIGNPVWDEAVWGYQERWAEYRYHPARVTGYFRSDVTGTLDAWHLAQNLWPDVALNDQFIQEDPPIDRIVAVSEDALGKQFLLDTFFNIRAARPLPMYSVPGLIDHF